MSNSYISSAGKYKTLYKFGSVSTTVNFPLPKGFTSFASIPLTSLTTREVYPQIFAFRHDVPNQGASDYFSPAKHNIAISIDTAEFPAAKIQCHVDYHLTDGQILLGILNQNGSDVTPIAPYVTCEISYFIWIY